MSGTKPTVVVTGISGNLGQRLLPQLADFQVVGVDLKPPTGNFAGQFVSMDFGEEASCRELTMLLKESGAVGVVHLAFIIDSVRSGILDIDRMWHINVAGTARVLEAITEANRDSSLVQRFVFPSSVSAYGSDLPGPVSEDFPLGAHTLPYAMHKMECDRVVQQRAPALRGCSVYMLRPHIFGGASVENYLLGAFRGTPNGRSKRAEKMRHEGRRLSCMLPYGKKYLEHKMQFVHVDDVARLMAHLLRKPEPEAQRLTILNVAGRGDALTLGRCIEMAQAKLVRVPGKSAMRMVLQFLWKSGVSAIPPEALPYMTGEYIMNTERLKKFLGADYEKVIRYTIADAFADSFADPSRPMAQGSAAD